MSSRATPGRTGPAGSRRPLAMLIALAAVLALGGCGPLGGSSAGTAVISPDAARATVPAGSPAATPVTTAPVSSPSIAAAAASPTPDARAAVVAAANRFMRAFAAGDYAAQWAQLDPGEQAIWPSPTDRASFLTAKFGGRVAGFQLGTPRLAASWTSHEDTAYTVGHPWQVPVSVTFSDASALQPTGVAASYGKLALNLRLDPATGAVTVAGEGPASLDAPLITPGHPAGRTESVPILMYHRVAPLPQRSAWTDSYGYQIEYGLTVPPDQFAAEMDDLVSRGYHAISLTRLSDALLYGLPLPAHPIVLTFDDGRQSPWFNAVPVLRQHGFTGEFFACAGFVGETNQTAAHLNVQRYLTWDQISGLNADGFWVEDHGQKDQQVLWGLSRSGLAAEVGQSAQALVDHTGRALQFVAYTGALWPYPQANQSGPAEQQLFVNLAALGYAGGVLDTRVPSTRESSSQLFQLPRIRVAPGQTTAGFESSLQP